MKNELRARLTHALQVSEDRRLGLRGRLEKMLSEDQRPRDGGQPSLIEEARNRDKCEHELELADEWCAATRALVNWLAGEVLGDPTPGDEGDNFYTRPHSPGLQVEPDEMPRGVEPQSRSYR